jgi:hypothetical protein
MQNNPFDNPETFDTFVVFTKKGRATFPGVNHISVRGGINEDTQDVKNGTATTTVLNYQPHEVVVRNKVWDAQGYNKISAIVDLMRPLKGLQVEELECVHPMLELRKVQRLYIFDIESPEFDRREGWVTIFRLREWWPEETEKSNPKKMGKDAASVGNVDSNPEDFAVTQFEVDGATLAGDE